MPDTSTAPTATNAETRAVGSKILGFILGGGGAIVDKLFDVANFFTKNGNTFEGLRATDGDILDVGKDGGQRLRVYADAATLGIFNTAGAGVGRDGIRITDGAVAFDISAAQIGTFTSTGFGIGTAAGPVGTPTKLEFDTTYANTSTPSNQQLKVNLVPVSANEGYGWSVDNLGRLWHHAGSSVGPTGAHVFATGNSARWQLVTAGHFQPVTDNAYALGGASNRPTSLYAVTNVISTSDEREKTWRGAANQGELAAARRIIAELGFYQWNDAIVEKGPDGARYHFGVRAQRVWTIMADEGLIDPVTEGATPICAYAFLCYDEWDAVEPIDAVEEVRDEEGEIIVDAQPAQPGREAGNRFGIRPDQLALFLIAAQEARLSALEAA